MSTPYPDPSEATARSILQHYLHSVTADAGNSIEAILLVGSLVTGSYVPGPGDIDQITILQQEAPHGMENNVLQHIHDSMAAFGRAVNLSSTVYRRSDLDRPWPVDWDCRPETKHLVCVPEELLRIHDHAQVLYSGSPFELAPLPKPTMAEMISYHERWRRWGQQWAALHPELQPSESRALPPRIAVQIILSNAIWHYYYATGHTCFNKHQIALRLRSEVPEYRFQEGVELATRIRMSGFEDVSRDILESLNTWSKRFRLWRETKPVDAVPR